VLGMNNGRESEPRIPKEYGPLAQIFITNQNLLKPGFFVSPATNQCIGELQELRA
jgi:hypothetical protein